MNRTKETILLIEKYLELSAGFLVKLSSLQRKFRNDLKAYLLHIKKNVLIDEEYFNTTVIPNEDIKLIIFKELEPKKEELLPIFVRLWNLHQSNGSYQISNSDFHFRYLVDNSRKPLIQLGFHIKEEQESKIEYMNSSGIIISVVYQRYDPPEVCIKRLKDKSSIGIGTLTEQYFDKELKVFKKYAGQESRFFNFSSFDYYDEFLRLYLNKIVDLEDFVKTINDWIKNKYNGNNTAL